MEKIPYGGWKNCYRLANDAIEVVVTGDVGPRIIRLATPGGSNLFKEFPDMMGRTGGDEWRIYGGHRLWHAPESDPRTYCPDNRPVTVEPTPEGLRAIQEVEIATGIEKQIDIRLDDSAPHVTITHRLINRNLWTVTLAPWAISVMAPGGAAIIPQPAFRPHNEALLPSHPLVLWPYTKMNDPRWTWGGRCIRLRQDPQAHPPQKIGMALPGGKAYYSVNDRLFVKCFRHRHDAEYPDFGCSFETFTNNEILEMESLGPLTELGPGDGVEHVEHWFVFGNIKISDSEERAAEELEDVAKRSDEMIDESL